MAAYINTNISSLNSQRALNSSQSALQTSLQRLSSGLRINSAKDDAAGLAVSQQMTSQIRGLTQATRNANDGISMVQTAEGAMGDMQGMLQRMKEIATQAANGAIDDTNRGFIATEVGQIKDELENIASRTKFNGRNLLTGSLSTTIDNTGTITNGFSAGAAAVTNIDVSKAKAGTTFTFGAYAAGDNKVTLSDGTNSQTVALGAIAADGSQTLDFSALGVKLTLSSVAGDTADNIGGALAADTVITAAGSGSVNLQVGADTTSDNEISFSFADMRLSTGTDASITALRTAITGFTDGSATQADAKTLMSAVDGALSFFSNKRSDLGAVLNRLDSTISSNNTTIENLSASRSRIQDTDFAAETASMTRNQILQQAGTAMLAQANSLPNGVLSLLRG